MDCLTSISAGRLPGARSAPLQLTATQTLAFYDPSGVRFTGRIWWHFVDPYGNILFSTNFNDDASRLNLTAGGTYTVLVEGDLFNTGTSS